MQIANKETTILYNDFLEKVSSLENIQNYIQTNVLFQFKNDKLLTEEEKENLLLRIEVNTPFNNEVLNQIYDGYVKRYEHTFKRNITNSIDKREILPQRDNEDTTENTISVKDDKFYINDEEVSEEEFTRMKEENIKLN